MASDVVTTSPTPTPHDEPPADGTVEGSTPTEDTTSSRESAGVATAAEALGNEEEAPTQRDNENGTDGVEATVNSVEVGECCGRGIIVFVCVYNSVSR